MQPVLLDQLRTAPATVTRAHLETVAQLLAAGCAQEDDGVPATRKLILDLTAALGEVTAPAAGSHH